MSKPKPTIAEALQKIYLSVGKVISPEAAQAIIKAEYPEFDIDLGDPATFTGETANA